MILYEGELEALKKSGRYRTREIVSCVSKDFASNDYLGLSHNKELHEETCQRLSSMEFHSSKASMLVNGYHQVHKDFEEALCAANGFEEGIVLGSGFNANIALIESLVRKGDTLFMDELYHASGVLASKIGQIDVVFFKHNDMQALRLLLQNSKAKRKIVAVEGIYSMDGDICSKEVFELVDEHEALLIVDEAHSSGVLGKKLMGLFDHYEVEIKPHYIKMGTLGKAYGSFGAFILASCHVIEYLVNRAKPIIYATSLSLYDTLLGHNALKYILENRQKLQEDIQARKQIVFDGLGISMDALIAPIVIGDNKRVMEIKKSLLDAGFSVGGIRQPTVSKAIIRVIARVGEDKESLRRLCRLINDMK